MMTGDVTGVRHPISVEDFLQPGSIFELILMGSDEATYRLLAHDARGVLVAPLSGHDVLFYPWHVVYRIASLP